MIIVDMVFDDVTTWHDYVDIKNIYVFYMMTHMRVFALVLRVFTRDFTVMCLMDVMCTPIVGGVASVSTMMNLGWNRDATVSLRGLPKPTPVSGLVYDF